MGKIKINIICSNGTKFSVKSIGASKVDNFKGLLAKHSRIPADKQTLVYRGMTLKDDETLDKYGLQEDHTIHMVIFGFDVHQHNDIAYMKPWARELTSFHVIGNGTHKYIFQRFHNPLHKRPSFDYSDPGRT